MLVNTSFARKKYFLRKMSNLSGYDSEVVGFDSISMNRRPETSSSTQTTDFSETSMSSQTTISKDCGSMTTPDDLDTQDDVLSEYPPSGLNEFLRRVVPAMMEQLDEKKEMFYNSSDSEEDDMIIAKLIQEIKVTDISGMGGGDQATSVLSLSWSSAGNSLAVSVGRSQHENWCTHDGLVRIYTLKHSSGDNLVHSLDINEKNCVSAVKYHPSLAALLAYGTTAGEVVMCDLRNGAETTLTSPSGCHGSKRVSSLKWADAHLANTFLTMQINKTGKRRSASDQILFSTGSDGTLNVWQVNFNLKIFESVVAYSINGTRKMAAPDISCFDFIKAYPLRRSDEKVADDVFVVGTKSGSLFLCKIKCPLVMESDLLDPVCEVLDGHATCVLDVAFSGHKPGVFVSVSIDSELRVYDINQASPLKVFHIESPVSCAGWLPTNPCVCVLGLAQPPGGAVVYNTAQGRRVPVDGLEAGAVTALDVNQSGSCRIACGDRDSKVRVWEVPSRRIRFSPDDLDF